MYLYMYRPGHSGPVCIKLDIPASSMTHDRRIPHVCTGWTAHTMTQPNLSALSHMFSCSLLGHCQHIHSRLGHSYTSASKYIHGRLGHSYTYASQYIPGCLRHSYTSASQYIPGCLRHSYTYASQTAVNYIHDHIRHSSTCTAWDCCRQKHSYLIHSYKCLSQTDFYQTFIHMCCLSLMTILDKSDIHTDVNSLTAVH